MGSERRGRAVHGRLEVNPSGEEPTDRPRQKNAGLWEPYDGRLSRTVLREREGEVPSRHSPAAMGPMLSPRVPHHVPIPGPRMERETPGQRPRPNYGHPQGHNSTTTTHWVRVCSPLAAVARRARAISAGQGRRRSLDLEGVILWGQQPLPCRPCEPPDPRGLAVGRGGLHDL